MSLPTGEPKGDTQIPEILPILLILSKIAYRRLYENPILLKINAFLCVTLLATP